MARPKGLSQADRALWAAYARSVRPLPGRRSLPAEPGEPGAEPPLPPPEAALALPASRSPAPVQVKPVQVNMPPPGLDRGSWQRFRSPDARPGRVLDLHGMTATQAHLATMEFVLAAYRGELRVIEIITGKGEILHRELPHWLNAPQLRPVILALAYPHAANTGAMRVLLRRIRQSKAPRRAAR